MDSVPQLHCVDQGGIWVQACPNVPSGGRAVGLGSAPPASGIHAECVVRLGSALQECAWCCPHAHEALHRIPCNDKLARLAAGHDLQQTHAGVCYDPGRQVAYTPYAGLESRRMADDNTNISHGGKQEARQSADS